MSTDDEPSVPELLRRLNALRADLDMPPLRSWSRSKAALVSAVRDARDTAQELLEARVAAAEAGPSVLEGHPLHTEMKALDATKPKRTAVVKDAPKPKGDTFTLSELAEKHDILPKNARSKARRFAEKLRPYQATDGWVFKSSGYDAVKKIIIG